ncbi:MAG TPA: hypothetical protein VMT61_03625 [Candidatus Binataceae bacterium]|nr:hypothetical protein [Candidatus Binataceae bacterium]
MKPFDYVMVLMSFVYGLAIAHILATFGDLISATKRLRFSWLNAAWMLFSLLSVVAWWIGLWDLRGTLAWSMGEVGILFVAAAILYLQARLTCLRVPLDGIVDLAAFHREEGWKYMLAFAIQMSYAVLVNVLYVGAQTVNQQNLAVSVMTIAPIAAAIFKTRLVQVTVVLIVGSMLAWYFAALQLPLN